MSTSGPVFIVRTVVKGKRWDLATIVPPEAPFTSRLPVEAIAGNLLTLLPDGQQAESEPDNFAANPAFLELMHRVIARDAPDDPEMQEEARRQGNGWVYLLDGRTPNPLGRVPVEDLLGAFEVRGGQLLRDSYVSNPNHSLLTRNGFFRLNARLHQCLLDEIARRWTDA